VEVEAKRKHGTSRRVVLRSPTCAMKAPPDKGKCEGDVERAPAVDESPVSLMVSFVHDTRHSRATWLTDCRLS